MPSTVDWLRGRTDAQLAELLTRRPDLLVPAPSDLEALARRIESPSTARRALELLDAFGLQVLQALLALDAVKHSASPSAITALLGGPAEVSDVTATAEYLQTLALVRGDGDGYRIAASARDALGAYPAGLGAPSGIAPHRLSAALAAVDDAGRALLERLVPGPPMGVIDARSPLAPTVDSLVRMGLLERINEATVTLPREVALALRGPHPLGPALPDPPDPGTTTHGTTVVDGAAAGQALAAHARWLRLLDVFGTGSIGALKAGGIGIVTLRRIARDLDVDTHVAALHVELLGQAGLVAAVVPRSGNGTGHWIPTQAADAFTAGTEAAGWALLASAWMQMRRDPSRVGERDLNDKIRNVLSYELRWRHGPDERRRVLGELAALAPGTGAEPKGLVRRMAFRSPLRDPAALEQLVTAVLAEATELGVVAFDALSGPARALLDDDIEAATTAIQKALPPAVDQVLVQADMTVVAPGRLTPELAAALAGAADVESAGGATVYRISEASLRRAYDAGASSAQLHALLEKHSATPVPQSIGYLIDDVARRHGVLRAGSAAAYLRSEDPALINQAVAAAATAGITLRALAPTVAVTDADLTALAETLRGAGLAPAAEDANGSVLDLRPRPRRTRVAPRVPRTYAEPSPPSSEQIDGLVRRLRAGDAVAADGQDPRDVLAVLREAARHRTAVWIGYADAEGGTTRRIVEPIVVSGGSMIAYDRLRRTPRTFTVHRISSAHPESA